MAKGIFLIFKEVFLNNLNLYIYKLKLFKDLLIYVYKDKYINLRWRMFIFQMIYGVIFNKVGFYLTNNEIVRIKKITKCFIWCSLHIMMKEDLYHSNKYLTTIIKERIINK